MQCETGQLMIFYCIVVYTKHVRYYMLVKTRFDYIVIQIKFLTLGAHAQRGLQYSVCLSVCLSVCYNTAGLSSGQNAEISTSMKCRRYAGVF